MLRSLGLSSDLMVMSGQSVTEDHPDRVVMRTPDEPDYWHGNLIIIKDAPGDVVAQVAQFSNDFPGATHRTIVWDVPNLDPAPIKAALTPDGYDVDTFDVLALDGPIGDKPVPAGISVRAVETDADWAAVNDLQAEIAIEEGYDPVVHTPFLERRNVARRAQIGKGTGQWFGAFDSDVLAAQMGIFYDQRTARYQSVETRVTYRRRGICTALLAHCGGWARRQAPDATLVIVAVAGSDAGRLYRSMGFELVETLVEATKPGY